MAESLYLALELLSSDESIIKAIPYLNEVFIDLALKLKTDEARLKVLKETGKETEGNYDCVMRLVNELTTKKAKVEAINYFLEDEDYYRIVFQADKRLREEKVATVSKKDLEDNYIGCDATEIKKASVNLKQAVQENEDTQR